MNTSFKLSKRLSFWQRNCQQCYPCCIYHVIHLFHLQLWGTWFLIVCRKASIFIIASFLYVSLHRPFIILCLCSTHKYKIWLYWPFHLCGQSLILLLLFWPWWTGLVIWLQIQCDNYFRYLIKILPKGHHCGLILYLIMGWLVVAIFYQQLSAKQVQCSGVSWYQEVWQLVLGSYASKKPYLSYDWHLFIPAASALQYTALVYYIKRSWEIPRTSLFHKLIKYYVYEYHLSAIYSFWFTTARTSTSSLTSLIIGTTDKGHGILPTPLHCFGIKLP